MKLRRCLALGALVGALVLASWPSQAAAAGGRRRLHQALPACPIDPTSTSLDFKPVAAACGEDADGDFCSECVCALVGAYLPAFAAAGIKQTDATSFPIQTATAVIAACTQDYFVSMLTADVNVTALERLSRCDYSTAPPPCLAEVVARVDDPEVAAASRAADPAATEGDLTYFDDVPQGTPAASGAATALRVATVQATPAGATMTLSGQLNSIKDLVDAMLASNALSPVLTAGDTQVLQGISSDSAKYDAMPATNQLVKVLSNPVDVRALMDSLQALTNMPASEAAAPAGPGAAAAPAGSAQGAAAAPAAPAPASSGAAGKAVSMAVGGVMAALLLLAL